MDVAGFDWDDGNREHCQKHGLSLAEIEAMFIAGTRTAPDVSHAHIEDRLIAVGRTRKGRPLFVAFTFRASARGLLIRPVSAVTCIDGDGEI